MQTLQETKKLGINAHGIMATPPRSFSPPITPANWNPVIEKFRRFSPIEVYYDTLTARWGGGGRAPFTHVRVCSAVEKALSAVILAEDIAP